MAKLMYKVPNHSHNFLVQNISPHTKTYDGQPKCIGNLSHQLRSVHTLPNVQVKHVFKNTYKN